MPILKMLNKGRVPVKAYTDDVDACSIEQLVNIASLPIDTVMANQRDLVEVVHTLRQPLTHST